MPVNYEKILKAKNERMKKLREGEQILKEVYENISTNSGIVHKSTALKIFNYFNKKDVG